MSGRNAKLNIAGRSIRLPGYGQKDHMTLGNCYTTVLNAHGNPIKHYGDLNLGLNKFQMNDTEAIKRFLA